MMFVLTYLLCYMHSIASWVLHSYTENLLHDDPGQYTIIFAPGVTRVLLDAQIIDQIIINENKYHRLIINHSLLPDGVTTNHPDKALMITNDNCKCIIDMCIQLCTMGAWLPLPNSHCIRTGCSY